VQSKCCKGAKGGRIESDS